ncbi:hypothetical protein, partial [Cronobacter turicensis]|uniref:hypothetical protein n=1 Tax=Cronobacter turicensis TaxID=413502 RepID=UPI0035710214
MSYAPAAIFCGTTLVQHRIFASNWCGALRKNKQIHSKLFTSSQAKWYQHGTNAAGGTAGYNNTHS